MKKLKIYLMSFPLIFFTFISCTPISKEKKERPNFIIFIADDISWDDFGCYGNRQVKTPNIDKLSTEGMLLKICI